MRKLKKISKEKCSSGRYIEGHNMNITGGRLNYSPCARDEFFSVKIEKLPTYLKNKLHARHEGHMAFATNSMIMSVARYFATGKVAQFEN